MKCFRGVLSVQMGRVHAWYPPPPQSYSSGLKSLWLVLSLQAPLRPPTPTCAAAPHTGRKTRKTLKHLVVKSKCLGVGGGVGGGRKTKKIRSSLHHLKQVQR